MLATACSNRCNWRQTPTAAEAEAQSLAWLETALNGFRPNTTEPHEQMVLARALHALISNCTEAPGMLAGHVAAFPNRGTYPTHYLWDSCLQNLALELLEPKLAEDALLLLTENQRADGKMYHFICSTWGRPHETQPPLVGWAALRLIRARQDKALAAKLLPALQHNTRWWLTQRMTRFGLVAALHGHETGWDDSPRFGQGPIVATDINSFLVLQMRACAEFARLQGDEPGAAAQTAEADRLAQTIVDVLYDRDAGLFWDIHVASGQPLKLRTPALCLRLHAELR